MAWNNRGVSLFHLERYEDAQKSFIKSLDLNPINEKAWYNKGLIYTKNEDWINAFKCYEKSELLSRVV
jgi:tetratricopeptide (TPR) repeat protein